MYRQLSIMTLMSCLLVLFAGVSQCAAPDEDGDGYTADVDCNDTDPEIHPGQEEPCVCDGIDQNCNGLIDDFPCDLACPVDADGDGYDSSEDCDDTDPDTHPDQMEPCACDGIDQDCNGVVDDFPCAMVCVEDADKDGYDASVDCNDKDATVHPGAEEPCTCDGIDQNCDGQIDNHLCDQLPCYLKEGEVCGKEGQPECGQGLSCCYPCGVQGCENVCTPTCKDEPWCAGGCPLYP